jgi:hypothetical protein
MRHKQDASIIFFNIFSLLGTTSVHALPTPDHTASRLAVPPLACQRIRANEQPERSFWQRNLTEPFLFAQLIRFLFHVSFQDEPGVSRQRVLF